MARIEDINKVRELGLDNVDSEEEFNEAMYTHGYTVGKTGKPNPFPDDDNCTMGWVDGYGERELEKVDDHAYRTGRSKNGTGKLRNFRAMQDDKLLATFDAIIEEANDPEARERVFEELIRRNLKTYDDRFWEVIV